MKLRRFRQFARGHVAVLHFAVDSLTWAFSVPFAVWLRYDFDTGQLGTSTVRVVAVAIVLQGLIGLALGQYRSRWRYGTFDEVRVVALTATLMNNSVAEIYNMLQIFAPDVLTQLGITNTQQVIDYFCILEHVTSVSLSGKIRQGKTITGFKNIDCGGDINLACYF